MLQASESRQVTLLSAGSTLGIVDATLSHGGWLNNFLWPFSDFFYNL